MRRILLFILSTAVVTSFSACGDKKVANYQVPKEKEAHHPGDGHDHGTPKDAAKAPATAATQAPAPAASASGLAAAPVAAAGNSMANTAVPTASGAELTWKGPAHWQEKPASGMRKGTFSIATEGDVKTELAITAFPGDVGGEVANVNRWRGQLQLAPQTPDDVAKSVQRMQSNGLEIGWVEIANTTAGTPRRVLGAFVPHAGATWFFKLDGTDATVTKEKAAFLEFLKTIKPAAK